MASILGYGEDSFTLWALKNHLPKILNTFKDKTIASDCLCFYRPSFGRAGGKNSSEFGEFDAIVVSREKVYLVESKWRQKSSTNQKAIHPEEVQIMRHDVFSWYLTYWKKAYYSHWDEFQNQQEGNFRTKFEKRLPDVKTLLQENLEYVLYRILNHCLAFKGSDSIRNVLLIFFSSNKPSVNAKDFTTIYLDYSKDVSRNFIAVL